MKWFKHDCQSHNDEKMRDLIHEFGVEGYGVYMVLLELIGEKIDKGLNAKISISDRVLREKLRVSRGKLTKILAYFDQNLLTFSKAESENWIIECPNLLKRLDNWTINSQVTNKQPSTQQEEEVRSKNKNKKKETANAENDLVFFESLKTNQAYKHIDLPTELCKMDAWLSAHAGRKKTKRFVLNWLNKIEVPLPTEDIPDSLRRFIK